MSEFLTQLVQWPPTPTTVDAIAWAAALAGFLYGGGIAHLDVAITDAIGALVALKYLVPDSTGQIARTISELQNARTEIPAAASPPTAPTAPPAPAKPPA